MKTPLMTTSGTSGCSYEITRLNKSNCIVVNNLGAFVTKGVTLKPKSGNRAPRIIETRSGIINSIGLQNNGADKFIKDDLPILLRYDLPIIVNISANSISEFGKLSQYLCTNDRNNLINGIEINVSCPNIKEGGMAFGVNPSLVEQIVKTVKKNTRNDITIITKLTPNITDIKIPAKAAIYGGTDALSMINTVKAMAIDIESRKPFLHNKFGGLSGPAIKPIGIFKVYDCFHNIKECREQKIPIIGIGGISNYRDALEYIMAGASAIGIGTEWFNNTSVFDEVVKGLRKYIEKNNISLMKLIGCAHE